MQVWTLFLVLLVMILVFDVVIVILSSLSSWWLFASSWSKSVINPSSRSAFKLIELDERFGFLKNVKTAVDLGAAPGGWSQVLVSKLKPHSVIVAIDKADIDPIEGVLVIKKDIESQDTLTEILNVTGSKVDLVLSDMAAASTGHARTDHIRVMALCEIAMVIAENILEQKGTFVAKVLKGGTERELLDRLKRSFGKVRHAKPPASRADSAEVYVVAQGFRES